MEKEVRVHTTATVKPEIIEAVRKLAEEEGRSYSNMLENLLKTHPRLTKSN